MLGGQGVWRTILYESDWGVWHGMPLEVVRNNHSPAPIYVRQWDIVVLDRNLVL